MRAEDVLLVGELFDSLGWSTEDRRDQPFRQAFELFCKLLNALLPDERELILFLTRKYRWIKDEVHPKMFLDTWRDLVPQLAPTVVTVAVLPLIKPGAKGPKSSDYMFRIAQNYEQNLELETPGRQIKLCATAKQLGKIAGPDVALVLLDDYVGSGDTAIKCLKSLRKRYAAVVGIPTYALTLAAQRQAIAPLSAEVCKIVCREFFDKGISQNTDVQNIKKALNIMGRIEKRMGVPKNRRLGYGASEGLLTLTRTPNNTFPVFWTKKPVAGVEWPAPFPRTYHG